LEGVLVNRVLFRFSISLPVPEIYANFQLVVAVNLEQVDNLLCAQVNSASYPQRDGKWVVADGLQSESLAWLIGAVVCLLAANRGSNCSLTRAMDGRIVCCGIISSCQSAATSEIVKRFWSRVW